MLLISLKNNKYYWYMHIIDIQYLLYILLNNKYFYYMWEIVCNISAIKYVMNISISVVAISPLQ